MELISIIIPVYNVQEYIRRCVESILKQSYFNLEIILVDDGSTDQSGIICDEYAKKDSRIKVIHKVNGGLSDARNVGVEASRGKYITFIDSDDWVHKEYIRKLYSYIQMHSAQIAVANFIKLSDSNEIKNVEAAPVNPIKIMNNREVISAFFEPDGFILTISCGKLFERSLFENIKFPIGRLHEDEFTTYKLMYAADKIVFTKEVLLYYWQRDDSIMGKSKEKMINTIHLLEAFSERLIFLIENNFERESIYLQRHLLSRYLEADVNINKMSDQSKFIDNYVMLKKQFLETYPLSNTPISLKIMFNFYKKNPKLLNFLMQMYRKLKYR